MIFGGEFVAGVDLVDISLWLFTLFFLGLVLYLQREGMREGYPVESDETGKVDEQALLAGPKPKTFILPHGRGEIEIGYAKRDTRELALKRTAVWAGAPYEPTGDPMQDGVGPASYAMREDFPDLTMEGAPRIAPYRDSPGFEVAKQDRDPRGLDVVTTDKLVAGKVVDLWVDRSEAIIRYIEVEVPAVEGAAVSRNVLVPMPFVKVVGGRDPKVVVEAVTAAQLQAAPRPKEELSVTRREEDRISGYYGGGKLYATTDLIEPLL